MALYLTISEGTRPDETRPILACSDRRVIALVLREVGRMAEREDDTPAQEQRTKEGVSGYAA